MGGWVGGWVGGEGGEGGAPAPRYALNPEPRDRLLSHPPAATPHPLTRLAGALCDAQHGVAL